MNFSRVKQVIWKKNGVRKVHEGATSLVGTPWGVGRAPRLVASSCTFQIVYYFPNFLYIPKWTESTLWKFSSRFTYRTTYLLLFRILERSVRFPLCALPVSLFE